MQQGDIMVTVHRIVEVGNGVNNLVGDRVVYLPQLAVVDATTQGIWVALR